MSGERMNQPAVVITSIASDQHPILKLYAEECRERGFDFILVGDAKSPENFQLPGCTFLRPGREAERAFELAHLLPLHHYSRKNLGYLVAAQRSHSQLIETDDDNLPLSSFWAARSQVTLAAACLDQGWLNVYRAFTDQNIWPRGFPLERIGQADNHACFKADPGQLNCPVQQGLAEKNPDVDAIYRLTQPLPVSFRKGPRLALGKGTWCPFNSQNTAWFQDAFPLLYLPSHCSFRMTDIWRSLICERIFWENGWHVLFHEATVTQERNEHDLLDDFRDEIPGYLHNQRIGDALSALSLKSGKSHLGENLVKCYEALVSLALIEKAELPLVRAWLEDLDRLGQL